MATLALQPTTSPTGTTLTFAAAAVGGDKCPVGTNVLLLVRNDSASSVTVTLDATGLVFNGLAVPDTAVVVAAGAEAVVPVSDHYRASADGLAAITYSAVTTVTVAALSV